MCSGEIRYVKFFIGKPRITEHLAALLLNGMILGEGNLREIGFEGVNRI
jgi:hypothetical protein